MPSNFTLQRTPWQVTKAVWHAMFIREALTRTMKDRMAWFWMLAEPALIILIMVAIRAVVMGRAKHIAGAEFVPWLIVGLFGFQLFRENLIRSIGAIDANKALFAYRQVKPIDPVIVRCYLEGMIKSLIFILFLFLGELFDLDLLPDRPLYSLFGWMSLWMLGFGAGLTSSAVSELVPELGLITKIISLPLLIISGVLFPLNFVPHDLLVYMMWNPIVHGLEILRFGFFESYSPVYGTSLLYLWSWIIGLIAFGLSLHIRYQSELKRQ